MFCRSNIKDVKGIFACFERTDVVRLTSKSQQGERRVLSGSGLVSSSEGGGVVSGRMCVRRMFGGKLG